MLNCRLALFFYWKLNRAFFLSMNMSCHNNFLVYTCELFRALFEDEDDRVLMIEAEDCLRITLPAGGTTIPVLAITLLPPPKKYWDRLGLSSRIMLRSSSHLSVSSSSECSSLRRFLASGDIWNKTASRQKRKYV